MNCEVHSPRFVAGLTLPNTAAWTFMRPVVITIRTPAFHVTKALRPATSIFIFDTIAHPMGSILT
jgi:hypothetical protein